MLRIENVAKSFGGQAVLLPTSLTIEDGKTVTLIGPSGCGKSTLLRILNGLLEADQGQVYFRDEPLRPDNVLQIRHSIGYVLQDGGLFPHLTARKNVTLLAQFLGRMSARELSTRVEELAELTKLPHDALDRYPGQLSGGQRQRVAIMRALMLDPPLLLLDEPMGALDPLVRYDLQEDLKNIFDKMKKTVVLVTHDMGEAGFFGDDVILMAQGRLIQRGTLEEFFTKPAEEFVSRFISAQRFPQPMH